ncbi:hypothetical protein [Kribbella solani]|uniref:Uncharacterized protein n=1 Tax=Kribbella solani TaxID=236067 RepID=A0A841DNJ0_9ACTN|nr:hypothetical protein [Kribbella solani]MBB5980233.1 hypothetical protein [Kribbella solani]
MNIGRHQITLRGRGRVSHARRAARGLDAERRKRRWCATLGRPGGAVIVCWIVRVGFIEESEVGPWVL